MENHDEYSTLVLNSFSNKILRHFNAPNTLLYIRPVSLLSPLYPGWVVDRSHLVLSTMSSVQTLDVATCRVP